MTGKQRQELFYQWMKEHQGLLFKVLRAYAFTPEDRNDLFQEISIQLWNSIPSFQRNSSVPTWIYRVALYTAMTWNRREQRHRQGKQALSPTQYMLTETPQVKDDRLEWLYQQIAQLNEVDRSLCLLLLDGFSYREMANVLGISASNVGVKINRIKKILIQKSKKNKNDEI